MREEHIRVVGLRRIRSVLVKPDFVGGRSRRAVNVLGADIHHIDRNARLIASRIVRDGGHTYIVPGAGYRRIVEAHTSLSRPDVFDIRARFGRRVDIGRVPHFETCTRHYLDLSATEIEKLIHWDQHVNRERRGIRCSVIDPGPRATRDPGGRAGRSRP
jgi:hypothetical protein